ncbi:MAG: hypothetical protein AAFR17_06850 [Pseudomonadota bacterium]
MTEKRSTWTGWATGAAQKLAREVTGGVAQQLPRLPDIEITRPVEIPVYLLHHGSDPETYEILCDFQAFMAASQTGAFRRPVLRIWAGRQDFARAAFARQLRVAFSAQFEAVRAAHRAEQVRGEGRGWLSIPRLSFWDLLGGGVALGGSLIGGVLLYLAASATRATVQEVMSLLRDGLLGRMVRGAPPEERLEDLIAEKKSVIDAALADSVITLHPDLWRHAWRGRPPGPMTGMDRAAWPLPDFVQERLSD